ncbi:MAG: hypothetical protein RIS47_50 [Bacteroidota bacterium]|jgi:ribosomal protein S12 methylthiotransferase
MKTKQTKHKINIVTLGCSKNLVDSEQLARQIDANGLQVVHDSNDTDAKTVIINTCGFIGDAKEESVNTILEFAQAKVNGEIDSLYVMGCLVERYKKELRAEIADVDQFFGVNNIQEVVEGIGINYKRELMGERNINTPNHFAYLKISEGCNKTCAFCAIPLIRGKHKSKTIEELVDEATFLADRGVKELILIAQDLTFYGIDLYKKPMLDVLVEKLSDIPGLDWIRLHYVYPMHFPPRVLELMRQRDNICKYIDMPLQHISDNMLRTMRRGNTKASTYELIKMFKTEVPDMALRTTLLVGHPGETEADFEELKEFVRFARFDRLGVFTFSNEEDTHAAEKLTDDIPEEVKVARMEEILSIQRDISLELNQERVGKIFKVMIDRQEGAYYVGRTEYDSPEVDNEVLIESREDELEIGEFYDVKVTLAEEFDLYGELVD